VLVGISTGDDAGVYLLREDLAIVNTVDFFTPVVDDPFTYGQIAAANALSDVYAMGGIPKTALNIVCWPQTGMPHAMLGEILRGGSEKAREAGVAIVGGHSVADEEVKYGMAVTGVIDPRRIIRNVGARVGDALLLSKPLGTGVLMTALKRGQLPEDQYAAAVRWMGELNAATARAMLEYDVHAATDITGFGLLGHLANMCRASSVSAEIFKEHIPAISSEIFDLIDHECVPGGTRDNLKAARETTDLRSVSQSQRILLADAQTSGGLLLCVRESSLPKVRRVLARLRTPSAAVIGRIMRRRKHLICTTK